MQVAGELRARGHHARARARPPPCLELWRRAGVLDALGEHGVHETIDGAVAHVDRSTAAGTSYVGLY